MILQTVDIVVFIIEFSGSKGIPGNKALSATYHII